MTRFRRVSSVLLATLIASVFIFAPKASAASLVDTNKGFSFGAVFDRQSEVDKSNSLVTQKSNEVKVIADQLQTITETKSDLSQDVASLKQQLASLDDMFVHINRYAPDAAGNRYAAGNCTWYVKSMRPDIGNFWGNANTWYQNAKTQGWSVGDLPKKGAVATTTAGWAGHVAYVTGVSLDQKYVTIKEMNYGGLYQMNTRTVYYTEFKYIYELD